MYCIKCGSSVPDDAAFCGKCGAPQGARKQAAAVPPSTPTPQQAQPQPVQQQPQAQAQPQQVQQQPQAQPQSVQQQPQAVQQPQQAQSQPYVVSQQTYSYTQNPSTPPMGPMTVGTMPTPCPPPIKSDRSLPMYILLSIITCGIYEYYTIYSIAKDVNRMCESDGSSTGGLGLYILLSVVTCGIYSIYWQYRIANRLALNAPKYGLTFSETGTNVLLWDTLGIFLCGLGPFFALNIILKNTNAMAVVYNSRINTGL